MSSNSDDADRPVVVDDHKKGTLTDTGGGSPEAGSGDLALAQKSGDPVICQSLTASMDNLRIRNDIDWEAVDSVDLAELAQSRMETLKQKRMARKAAWIAESRKEVLGRKEFQRTNLLEVLDLLAWDGIVDNLWPEEKVKMSTMAWEWRKRLEGERVLFLFQKVFPILCKNHSFTIMIPNDKYDLTSDARIRDTGLASISRCRLVCGSWKKAVDDYLSIDYTTAPYVKFENQLDIDPTRYSTPILETPAEVRAFNLWSEQAGRNPFFTRKFIGFSTTTGESRDDVAYWAEVETLLHRLGGELWTLDLKFDNGRLDSMYELLCRILTLTPNLRRLCLLDRDRPGASGTGRGRRKEPRLDEFVSMKLKMEKYPLPELPHLSSIIFGEVVPALMVQAALTMYGESLELVEFVGVGLDKFTGRYMDPGEFFSARSFPLQKLTCQYENTNWESVKPPISHWNYQFSSLHDLRLTYVNVREGAQVANIFKTVNSCGATLRRLLLRFNFSKELTPESNWRDLLPKGLKFELPHLEALNLFIFQTKITDVDFLLPLVSLEKLAFSYDTTSGDDALENGTGMVQFAGFRNRLYESNLWTLLPELRLVTIKTVSIVEQRKNRQMRVYGMHILRPFLGPGLGGLPCAIGRDTESMWMQPAMTSLHLLNSFTFFQHNPFSTD